MAERTAGNDGGQNSTPQRAPLDPAEIQRRADARAARGTPLTPASPDVSRDPSSPAAPDIPADAPSDAPEADPTAPPPADAPQGRAPRRRSGGGGRRRSSQPTPDAPAPAGANPLADAQPTVPPDQPAGNEPEWKPIEDDPDDGYVPPPPRSSPVSDDPLGLGALEDLDALGSEPVDPLGLGALEQLDNLAAGTPGTPGEPAPGPEPARRGGWRGWFTEKGVRTFRRSAGDFVSGLADKYHTDRDFKDSVNTKLKILALSSAARVGASFVTGGASALVTGGIGALAQGVQTGYDAVNREFKLVQRGVQEEIAQLPESVRGLQPPLRPGEHRVLTPDDVDYQHLSERAVSLEGKRFLGRVRELDRSTQAKVAVEILGGATAGFITGALGLELQALGINEWANDIIKRAAVGAISGGGMRLLTRLVTHPKEFFTKGEQTGQQVLTSAVFGGALGGLLEAGRELGDYLASPRHPGEVGGALAGATPAVVGGGAENSNVNDNLSVGTGNDNNEDDLPVPAPPVAPPVPSSSPFASPSPAASPPASPSISASPSPDTASPTPVNTATPTTVPATATSVPPTATSAPPTATLEPTATTEPSPTKIPPTATTVPPTATTVPPTATTVPPTETTVPATAVPTETKVPTLAPTNTPTSAPQIATPITPTATPTEAPVAPPTNTPNAPAPAPTRDPFMKVIPGFNEDDQVAPQTDRTEDSYDLAGVDEGQKSYRIPTIQEELQQRQPVTPPPPQYEGVYPPEVQSEYRNWRMGLSPDGQDDYARMLDLNNTPVAAQPLTMSEPLYTGSTPPNPDIAPLGPDMLSTKGTIQGEFANYLFTSDSLRSVSVDQFMQSHNLDPNDTKLTEALEFIRDGGKFDPFNPNHIKIRDLLMTDEKITPEQYEGLVDATYAYAKRNTPLDNFNANPDYFDRTKGIYLPQDLHGWFAKLRQLK